MTLFLKEYDIEPVLKKSKNQANALMERVYQATLNMLVTKDFGNKLFEHIYT